MGDFALTGGCRCGAIRFSIRAPAIETHHCHCSICRKIHGSLFITLSVFPRAAFSYDKGVDNLNSYRTSATVRRNFCVTCGCHVTLEVDNAPDIIEIATGTLDNGAHPGHPADTLRHTYVGSKVPWHDITDKLPQFPEAG